MFTQADAEMLVRVLTSTQDVNQNLIDINTLKANVNILKADIATLKADVAAIKDQNKATEKKLDNTKTIIGIRGTHTVHTRDVGFHLVRRSVRRLSRRPIRRCV
jgi:outer membrane murein-binding lipoprotein Lpp